MSYLWSMSLHLTRDEIMEDKELVIEETIGESENTLCEGVSMPSGQLSTGEKVEGVFIYWKNKDDGKWHLAEAGYHYHMGPILAYLHDRYGEYFKEEDDWYRDFSYTDEEGPIVDTWQEGDVLNRLYAVGYMFCFGFLNDEDEPVKKNLQEDYDLNFIRDTYNKYIDRISLRYFPFAGMLGDSSNKCIPVIRKGYESILAKFPEAEDRLLLPWGNPIEKLGLKKDKDENA